MKFFGNTNSFSSGGRNLNYATLPWDTITRSANYLIAQIAGMRWWMKKFHRRKFTTEGHDLV